jgi:hypothetical protein
MTVAAEKGHTLGVAIPRERWLAGYAARILAMSLSNCDSKMGFSRLARMNSSVTLMPLR